MTNPYLLPSEAKAASLIASVSFPCPLENLSNKDAKEMLLNNRPNYRIQLLHVGMQPAGRLSVVRL